MKILEVLTRKFLTYGEAEVAFDDGLTAIVGANGTGKTALGLEATCWTFWGKTTRGTVPDGEVAVRFEAAGQAWEVYRLRKGKRAGALNLRDLKPDNEIRGKDDWRDQTGQTAQETQGKIEALVGSWDRFCAERVFSNRLRARFGSATDKERKALVESILGLERHERAAVLAREELGKRRNGLQAARQDTAGAHAVMARAQGASEGYGLPGLALDEAEQAARDADRAVDQVEAELAAARAAEEKHRARAGVLQKSFDQVVQQGRSSQAEADREVEAASAALVRAQDGSAMGDCPTCLTPAAQVPRERLRAHHEADAARHQDRAAELLKVVQAARGEAVELRDDLQAAQASLRAASGDVGRLEAARRESGARNVAAAQGLARARGRKETADAARAAFLDAEAEHGRCLAAEEDRELGCLEAEAVVGVLGSRGARVRRMDGALVRLTIEANRVLAQLGMGMRVTVRGSRTQASGKEVDEVSVLVEGAGGGEYDGASDGERARLDVAIMLGMSRVAGTGEGLLVFDEILDPLDDEGLERVVELLEEVSRERQVVLTTHNPRFLALLPNSAVWRVSRGADGLSRVES